VALRPPDLSEGTWLGATIGVGGLLCGIVSVAAIVWNSPIILLGIAAGSGWVLSMVFAVLYASQRRATRSVESEMDGRVRTLETDLAMARSQAAEWSTTSNNVAEAVRAVLGLVGSAPSAPQRRARTKSGQESKT
jgi:hypothetical protein